MEFRKDEMGGQLAGGADRKGADGWTPAPPLGDGVPQGWVWPAARLDPAGTRKQARTPKPRWVGGDKVG